MALDDLFKGIQQLSAGLQSLQTSRLLNNANEAVSQIRSSDMEAGQKRQQINNLAQDLTMRLVSVGGSVEGAAKLVETFTPKMPTIQTPLQGIIMGQQLGDPDLVRASKEAFEFQSDMKAQEAANTEIRIRERQDIAAKRTEEAKLGRESRSVLRKTQNQFSKDAKDIQETLARASQAQNILESTGDARKLAPSVLRPLLARAAGEVGNLAAQEQKAYEGRQDIYSKILRAFTTGTQSELTEADESAIKDLINVYMTSGESLLKDRAQLLTGQLSEDPQFVDKDPDELIRKITGGRFKSIINEQSPAGAPTASPQGNVNIPAPKFNINTFLK